MLFAVSQRPCTVVAHYLGACRGFLPPNESFAIYPEYSVDNDVQGGKPPDTRPIPAWERAAVVQAFIYLCVRNKKKPGDLSNIDVGMFIAMQ